MRACLLFSAFLVSCTPLQAPKTWDRTFLEMKSDICYTIDDLIFAADENTNCPPKAQVREVLYDLFYNVPGMEGKLEATIVSFINHDLIIDGGSGLATGMSQGNRALVVHWDDWDRTLQHELAHVWLYRERICMGDPSHSCSPVWRILNPIKYRPDSLLREVP